MVIRAGSHFESSSRSTSTRWRTAVLSSQICVQRWSWERPKDTALTRDWRKGASPIAGDDTHQRGQEILSARGLPRRSSVRGPDLLQHALDAIAELKAEGKCPQDTRHRQVKYLNNVVEADHGKLKLLIRPVRGFKTLKTAYATIKGFEVMRAHRRPPA